MSSIDIPIVLVGGREDEALGEKLLGVNPQQIMNTCGKLTLNQSALLLSKSSKILTHDTGMMHIAAALQKDVISVWGNTVPEFGMTPYYGSVKKETENIFQVDGLSCRPCSKIGFDSCPQKHFDCMNRQNVSAIVSSINQ
jgi:heptosyltransferase-2